jgi:hypothetical protein
MSQVIHVREALDLCARAMEDQATDDVTSAYVNTIYGVAGQLAAVYEITSAQIQADPRMSVPDWLVERYAVAELKR